MYKKSRNF